MVTPIGLRTVSRLRRDVAGHTYSISCRILMLQNSRVYDKSANRGLKPASFGALP